MPKWIEELRHPTAAEIAEARASAPLDVWLAPTTYGEPLAEPYPCRCHERKYRVCSAAFCPCAGRSDPPQPMCCAWRFGPADHVEAMREWRIAKLAREQEERA